MFSYKNTCSLWEPLKRVNKGGWEGSSFGLETTLHLAHLGRWKLSSPAAQNHRKLQWPLSAPSYESHRRAPKKTKGKREKNCSKPPVPHLSIPTATPGLPAFELSPPSCQQPDWILPCFKSLLSTSVVLPWFFLCFTNLLMFQIRSTTPVPACLATN